VLIDLIVSLIFPPRLLGGLDEQVNETFLLNAFVPFGDIVQVQLPRDPTSRMWSSLFLLISQLKKSSLSLSLSLSTTTLGFRHHHLDLMVKSSSSLPSCHLDLESLLGIFFQREDIEDLALWSLRKPEMPRRHWTT